MPEPEGMPEPPGQVSDAVKGNWVDTLAPDWARPYLRLSRADRPIGTWLLLLPCWWGVGLAAAADPAGLQWRDIWIALACAAGAWLMRGAGCTWNDITDREFDAQVARTRSRPIPSGQVTVAQAMGWMLAHALVSFVLLLTFNDAAIWLGVGSLALVAIYPFAKRFTWWPQVFLGLAFNWGALLAWTAHTGRIGGPSITLYLAGIAWTLFYDTIYAHQDKEDDALIGVKSTARLFGTDTHGWLRAFAILTVLLMSLAMIAALTPRVSALSMTVALAGAWALGWHLAWQLTQLDIDEPTVCLKLFRTNRNAGLIPAVALLLAALM